MSEEIRVYIIFPVPDTRMGILFEVITRWMVSSEMKFGMIIIFRESTKDMNKSKFWKHSI